MSENTFFQCKAGLREYVGHHYILISLKPPQLARCTKQDTPIRPNSNLKPKSGHLLTNTSDLMKDAVLFNSALHRRYTALCGLAPASLRFEAVWWSQVEGSPWGWKSNDAQCSRQGQVVSMDERYSWLRSLRLLLLYASVSDNPSITSHIFTSSVLYSQHLSVQLTNARRIHSLGLLKEWSWCWENSCLSVCPHRLQGFPEAH